MQAPSSRFELRAWIPFPYMITITLSINVFWSIHQWCLVLYRLFDYLPFSKPILAWFIYPGSL